jgi:anti-sigma regulatory factor (Ser/Thr protein kinase)
MNAKPQQISEPVATLAVPNTLRHGTGGVEILFNMVAGLPMARRYVFDMGSVKFIEPCGVIALLSAIRHCAAQSGDRVLIKNLNEQIYPYLHRMDFFQVTEAWLRPLTPLDEEWNRNAQTVNLLELTPVTGYDEVIAVVERAASIFASCLSPNELSSLSRVISELCQNIYQHSGDAHGCVVIQKYQPEQDEVFVCLAVGDSGCGIRANLIKRYRWLGSDPIDFVRAAMDGSYTSRPHGRGGLGLRTVRNIAAAHRGYVTVRSETAAVTDWGTNVRNSQNLALVAGTQVSVKMRASG